MTATEAPVARDAAIPLDDPIQLTLLEDRERRRRKRRNTIVVRSAQVLLLAVVLVAWQRVPDSGVLRELNISRPLAIWDAIWRWVSDGTLQSALGVTMVESVWGFLAGLVGGMIVGLALGISKFASAVLRPFIMAAQNIPRLALVPLFLLWFGVGPRATEVLVFTLVFFLVFNSTYAGVLDVDQRQIDAIRLMRGSQLQVMLKVILPSVAAWVISGLRVSVPFALIGAVTGELIAANNGMGFLLQQAAGQFYSAGVFAAVVVLMVVGVILDGLVTLLARWLLRWKGDTRLA